LTISTVLILKKVQHFRSRTCSRLQVKSEEEPNVVDDLQELLSITGQHSHIKVKVKWFRYRPGLAQRVGRGIALLFHDCGTWRGWVVSTTPQPHFPPEKNRYPFYRRLGGPHGRSGWAENLVPTGILSGTVQSVVGRYTDKGTRLIPQSYKLL